MRDDHRKTESVPQAYAAITATVLLMNALLHMFMLPNHFVFGGVSGLSQVLAAVTPISFGTWNLSINIGMLVLAFICLGRKIGARVVYVSLLSSLELKFLEQYAPVTAPLTHEPLLEMIITILAIAAGSAVLFHFDTCSGGTDIAAMIVRKYIRVDMGIALLAVDFMTVAGAFYVFGTETGIFSLCGLAVRSLWLDTMMETLNLCKCFTIITDTPEPICSYVGDVLDRGVTIYQAEGGYTHLGKSVILTVVGRNEAVALRRYLRQKFPDTFVVITSTSEVVGRGFLLE